ITVPRNTPPRRPSTVSRKSVGAHSRAYGPRMRGVVTECATCHHALSASCSKNAFSTRHGGASMTIATSRPGATLDFYMGIYYRQWSIVDRASSISSSCSGLRSAVGACLRDQVFHFTHQRRDVIRDAVLDGPFDSACVCVL